MTELDFFNYNAGEEELDFFSYGVEEPEEKPAVEITPTETMPPPPPVEEIIPSKETIAPTKEAPIKPSIQVPETLPTPMVGDYAKPIFKKTKESIAERKAESLQKELNKKNKSFKQKMMEGQISAMAGDYSGKRQAPKSRYYWKAPGEQLNVVDKLRDVAENPSQLMPFIADARTGADLAQIIIAAKNVEGGMATEDQLNLLNAYIENADKDKTFGYKVANVLSAVPAFAAELAATAGFYNVPKETVKKTSIKMIEKMLTEKFRKTVKGKMLEYTMKKIVPATIGASVQAIPSGITRIPAGTLKRLIPELDIQDSEIVIQPNQDENLLSSIKYALGDHWVEVVSERSGGLFTDFFKTGKHIIGSTAMKSAIVRRLIKNNPIQPPSAILSKVKANVKKYGWNGFIEEMFEERVGEVGRALLGLEEYKLPSPEQLAVEMVSFAIPGIGISVADMVVKQQEAERVQKELDKIAQKQAVEAFKPEKAQVDMEKERKQKEAADIITEGLEIEKEDVALKQKKNEREERKPTPETPTIYRALESEVEYQGRTGTLSRDDEGNVTFEETGTDIIEPIGRTVEDLFKQTGDLGINIMRLKEIPEKPTPKITLITNEGQDINYNSKPYKFKEFKNIGSKKQGVKLTDETGKEVTIKDPDLVNKAVIAQNRVIEDTPENEQLVKEKDIIVNEAVKEETNEKDLEYIDRVLGYTFTEEVENIIDGKIQFSEEKTFEVLSSIIDASDKISEIEGDYAQRASQSLLDLAEEITNVKRAKELPIPKRQDKDISAKEPRESISEAKPEKIKEVKPVEEPTKETEQPTKQIKEKPKAKPTEDRAGKKSKKTIRPIVDDEIESIPEIVRHLKDSELGKKQKFGTKQQFPDWWKSDIGWTRDEIYKVLGYVEQGKPLTEKQNDLYEDVLESYKKGNQYKYTQYLKEKAVKKQIDQIEAVELEEMSKSQPAMNALLDVINAEEKTNYTMEELKDVIQDTLESKRVDEKPVEEEKRVILAAPKEGEIEALEKKQLEKKQQKESLEREKERIDKKLTQKEGPKTSLFPEEQITDPGKTIGLPFDHVKQKPTKKYNFSEISAEQKKIKSYDIAADEAKALYEDYKANKDLIIKNVRADLDILEKTKRKRKDTKDKLAKNYYDSILDSFTVLSPRTYSYVIDFFNTDKESQLKTKMKALDDLVAEINDTYIEQKKHELLKRKKDFDKAINNPETLEELRTKMRYKELTQEEKVLLDKLVAEKTVKKEVKPQPKITGQFEIKEDIDTRDQSKIWVAKLTGERISKEGFSRIRGEIKNIGGYYSRFKKGFIFKEDPTSKLNEAFPEEKKEEQPTTGTKEKRQADALRAKADAMQKTIDERLAPRATDTARRARMASGIEAEGRNLQRIQKTLRILADKIENGEAVALANIKNKTELGVLISAYNSVKYKAFQERSKTDTSLKYEAINEIIPTDKEIELAEMPAENIYIRNIISQLSEAEKTSGYKNDYKSVVSWVKKHGPDREYGTPGQLMREKLTKLAKKFIPDSILHDLLNNHKRLENIGIDNKNTFRTAMREYRDIIESFSGESKTDKAAYELKQKESEVTRMKIPGFFPTPDALIDNMFDLADIENGMDVLEPSAGRGDIADRIKTEYNVNLDVIEFNGTLRNILELKSHNVIDSDFLGFEDKIYDRIIMNPPFEKYQYVEHVQHAYEQLKPGGKLVAIMAESAFSNQQRKAVEFRDWLDSVGVYSIKNEAGSFKQGPVKTGVNTRTVVIEKMSADKISESDTRGNLQSKIEKTSSNVNDFINTNIPVGLSIQEVKRPIEEINLPKGEKSIDSVDPKAEKAMEEAKGLLRRSWLYKSRKWIDDVQKSFSRTFRELDRDRFPVENDILRRYSEIGNISKVTAYEVMKGILVNIQHNKSKYKVFSRYIMLKDLLEDAESGLHGVDYENLPFYENIDSLRKDVSRYKESIELNPDLKKAIEMREDFMNSLKLDLVENELLSEKVKDKENYFRHQVLMYMNDRDDNLVSQGRKDVRLHKKGWQKARTGSKESFNTEYMEAEFEVISQALEQLETKKILEELKTHSDISQTVKELSEDGKLDPKLIPDGYTMWQPVPGNFFYKALSISEKTAIELALDPKSFSSKDIKKIIALGAKRETWVIPEELAYTLDNFIKEQEQTALRKLNRQATKTWKQWTLINDFRVLKYNINNMSGDLDFVMAAQPGVLKSKYMKTAAKELWGYHKGKAPSSDIQEALKNGVLTSSLTLQEIPDIRDQQILESLAGNAPIWRKWWTKKQELTTLRENWLRLAAYKYYKENLKTNKKLIGASNKKQIDALWDAGKPVEQIAAKLARELTGDYGNISVAGRYIREEMIPFYSWMETNFRRYIQLMRNVKHSETDKAGVSSAIAWKTTKLAAKIGMLYIIINAWNHLFFPDEEEELSLNQRRQLHLILGRHPDGRIKSIRIQGAFSDLLSYIGLEDAPSDVEDLIKGRKEFKTIAKEALLATPTKLYLAAAPYYRTIAELISGKSFWPDPTNPRYIRDRKEHALRLLSLEKLYRWGVGRPTLGIKEELMGLIIYSSDPGQAAYYSARQLIFDYMKKQDIDVPKGEPTARSNALYYYKQALKMGDAKAAKKYKEEYKSLGGTLKGYKASIKKAHPIASLPKRYHKSFAETLNEEDRIVIKKAIKWYNETYKGKGVQ
jgi:phospholipid N-methyltransferase